MLDEKTQSFSLCGFHKAQGSPVVQCLTRIKADSFSL